jgi:hypothetical protein
VIDCAIHGRGDCVCRGARYWMDRALEAERAAPAPALSEAERAVVEAAMRAWEMEDDYRLEPYHDINTDNAIGHAREARDSACAALAALRGARP